MRKKLLRSRSGFEKPESREEAIMQNILGASNVLEPSESNIEEILKSILYNTPYTKEAEFEIEKILLAIKNNGTYDGEGESRDMKILLAILRDSNYTEEPESRIEELFIEWLQQRSSIKVLEGVPPLTFPSRGLPLINYLIEGNAVQNGTPARDSPIMPQGCGDLETSGEKAGQYKIPISSNSTTTPVYLGEVQSTRRIKKLVLDGTEDWTISSAWKKTNTSVFYFPVSDIGGTSDNERYILSTHFASKSRAELYRDDIEGIGKTGNNAVTVRVDDTIATTVNDFKAWLRDNNITVWYVLATPETGIVNEPLRKIGNYADSISMEQTGIEIPTINGSNTFDVDTTVKPSNVYIEYK